MHMILYKWIGKERAGPPIALAYGLPCAFEEYEVLKEGVWKKVKNSIPTNKDRIRLQKIT